MIEFKLIIKENKLIIFSALHLHYQVIKFSPCNRIGFSFVKESFRNMYLYPFEEKQSKNNKYTYPITRNIF